MIITLKGATASKNLGGLNFYSILVNKSSGVTVTLDKTTVSKDTAASETVTGTLTVAEGYTLESVKIMMGNTDKTSAWYNSSTGAITISGITANVVITAVATSNSGSGDSGDSGDDTPDNPSIPTNGQWLSVLLTGDENAHENFMNGSLSGAGSLATGRDVIYATSNVQALLEGKKIYKIASNGLNKNTITLYSNPWKGDATTNTTDGRAAVGTVTSTSTQAPGTIVEYSVSNPSAIKDNET